MEKRKRNKRREGESQEEGPPWAVAGGLGKHHRWGTWKGAGWLELGVALGLACVLHQPGTQAEGAPGGRCSSPISTEPPTPWQGAPVSSQAPAGHWTPGLQAVLHWVGPC